MQNFNSLGCLVLEISAFQYEACHGFRAGTSVHKLFVGRVYSHLGLCCIHYLENSFYDLVKSQMNNLITENMFSLCPLNIWRLRAKLSAFELTLHNLGIHFQPLVFLELGYMTTTVICIILMGGYNLIEIHRQSKKGGGVGVFLDNSIPYQIRSNLCLTDDVSECIFIEIDKEIFK